MTCIKTGFHGFVEPYQEYIYGDAFAVDPIIFEAKSTGIDRTVRDLKRLLNFNGIGIKPIYLFRIVSRSPNPFSERLHFTIHNYSQWWDKGEARDERINSSMLVADVTNHGYEGVPINVTDPN